MVCLRIPFMMLAVVNLLAGIWAGLTRMGWNLPLAPLTVHHGAIMVGGFLTSLITLEKVIPLKRNFLLIIPFMSTMSLIMVVPGYFHSGLFFLLAGSMGLLAVHAYYVYVYPRDLSAFLMLMGASCLVVGNVMLLQTRFYPSAFPWWMGFILLTITGERLELSKFLPVSKRTKYLLVGLLGLFLLGVIIPFHANGKYLSGLALIGIAFWMLRNDIISIGLKKDGLIRFSAMALLLANGWLLIEGILMIGLPNSLFSYDILVHLFFIGYAFSMIFAHGPIILPGVLGIALKPYHPILYSWLFLVQGSLLFRVGCDAYGSMEGRKISGILTGVGIVLYFITLVTLVIRTNCHAKAT